MTVPTDFDSYAFGVRLNSASYSGGANGTFADLVHPSRLWTAAGTPVFTTEAGREGISCSGDINASVRTNIFAMREMTIVVIGRYGANSKPLFGGTADGANTQWLSNNSSNNGVAMNSLNGANCTLTSVTSNAVLVQAGSLNPITGQATVWALDSSKTIKKGTPVTATSAQFVNVMTGNQEMAFGEHRTTYHTGWGSDVFGFSRDLIARDPTNLESLMQTIGGYVSLYP